MRVLLNTSFLLSIVGVVVREVEGKLHRLWNLCRSGGVELYYVDLNLLKIAWRLNKLNHNQSIVEIGLGGVER